MYEVMRIILFTLLVAAAHARVDPRCPPPSGNFTLCVITKESCFPGRPCPKGLICCRDGCGSICKPPVYIPNPKCPANDKFGPCVETKDSCLRDKECSQGYYCCPDGCGRKCIKPGCPVVNINPLIGGICFIPNQCQVDGDCHVGDICCRVGCYNRCVKSLLPQINKPGVCPKVPTPRPQCLVFQNDCKDDSGCPGDQKCCSVTCGIGCVKPIAIPPTTPPNTKPVCPVVCSIYCEYGFRRDRNGCEYCKCKDSPCHGEGPPVKKIKGDVNVCGNGGEKCPNGSECVKDNCDRFSVCCPICPPVCMIYCPNGNVLDKNGCPTCKCKVCSDVICAMYCEYGFERDINGCEICKCKDTPCTNGAYPMVNTVHETILCKVGKFSCPKNGECTPTNREHDVCCPTCPPVYCKQYCEHGFKKDKDGCEICACRECAPVLCYMLCQYGWRVDKYGCEYCSCKETPCQYGALPASDTSGKYLQCGRGGTHCPNGTRCEIHPTDGFAACCPDCKTKCLNLCEYGFKLENGCPTRDCQCKETPCRNGIMPLKNMLGNTVTCLDVEYPDSCPKDSKCTASDYGYSHPVCCPNCLPVACFLYCPLGYKVDKHGCEICSCIECPEILCALYCKHGYKQDKNGCDICECQESSILPRNFGCPTPPSRFLVKCSGGYDTCNSNFDCARGQICCNNPCGRYCTDPVPIKDGFCPARPDPSSVDCASFRDNCYLDSDCPDFRKCCPTACGNFCQAPMPTPADNPGVCKYVPIGPLCLTRETKNRRYCKADFECASYEKCCQTECGQFCLESEPLVVNPGKCPMPPKDVLCGHYEKLCNQDGNCPPFQKCCEDNCGTSCKEPVPKPGVCPAPRDPAVVLCPVGSKDECITDLDCPGDDKCCKDPCGKRCDLVRPKPGMCPVPPDPSVVLCSIDSKDECTNDRDCPIDLKCCDHPCGRRCDLVRPKPGVCPAPPRLSSVLCSIDSKDECTYDYECPIDLKCCDHPCGTRCDLVKPVKCPMDVLLPCPSFDECSSDSECLGDELCCSALGCPRCCVDPVIGGIKPGSTDSSGYSHSDSSVSSHSDSSGSSHSDSSGSSNADYSASSYSEEYWSHSYESESSESGESREIE